MFNSRLSQFISWFQTARWTRLLGLIQVLALLVIFYPEPANADDFQRDMTRLQDGLRTDGFAQTIAAIASTVVVILVNGAEIGRTLIQPKDGKEGEQRKLLLQVHTRDITGASSTTIDPNTGEPIYVQACVLDSDKGVIDSGATSTIRFTLGGGDSCVALKENPPQGGWRVASVTSTPADSAPDYVMLYVSATIQGQQISAPVKLTIQPGYKLEFF